MLENAWIYLNKQSSEYVRILNISNVVHSITSLYKLLSSYRDRSVFIIMPECGCATRNIQGRGDFVELGHFDFVKNTRGKDSTGNFLSFFSQIFSKLHFQWKINPMVDTIKTFLSKSKHFFDFLKRAGRPPLTYLGTFEYG